jgi:hypothetical protein
VVLFNHGIDESCNQDGSDGSVASVARSMGFDPIQHISPPSLRGGKPDGAVLIAAQYKFALSR